MDAQKKRDDSVHVLCLTFCYRLRNYIGVDDIYSYDNGLIAIQYLADLDKDNTMEIISKRYGWEWHGYMTSKLQDNKITNYCKWYAW